MRWGQVCERDLGGNGARGPEEPFEQVDPRVGDLGDADVRTPAGRVDPSVRPGAGDGSEDGGLAGGGGADDGDVHGGVSPSLGPGRPALLVLVVDEAVGAVDDLAVRAGPAAAVLGRQMLGRSAQEQRKGGDQHENVVYPAQYWYHVADQVEGRDEVDEGGGQDQLEAHRDAPVDHQAEDETRHAGHLEYREKQPHSALL